MWEGDRIEASEITVRAAIGTTFPSVSDQETLMVAVKQMAEFGLPAVPAIDSEGRSVGLVSKNDIIHLLAAGTDVGRPRSAT